MWRTQTTARRESLLLLEKEGVRIGRFEEQIESKLQRKDDQWKKNVWNKDQLTLKEINRTGSL